MFRPSAGDQIPLGWMLECPVCCSAAHSYLVEVAVPLGHVLQLALCLLQLGSGVHLRLSSSIHSCSGLGGQSAATQ